MIPIYLLGLWDIESVQMLNSSKWLVWFYNMSAFNLPIGPSLMAQLWFKVILLLGLFSLFSWPSQLWFVSTAWWLTAIVLSALLLAQYWLPTAQPRRLLLRSESEPHIKLLVGQHWLSFRLRRRSFVNDYCCLLWLQAEPAAANWQIKQQFKPQSYRLWLFRDSMSQSSYRCLARTILRLRRRD